MLSVHCLIRSTSATLFAAQFPAGYLVVISLDSHFEITMQFLSAPEFYPVGLVGSIGE